MQRKPNFLGGVFLSLLIVFSGFGPSIEAQTAPPPPPQQMAPPTPQQLDQLLAPVALYPDALLAQITTASTDPQEILDVDNWLAQNPGLSGAALTDAAQKQGFDPAFIALVTFPQILDMMARNIDDYAAIGDAFSADQGSVTASIQRLRAQAYASGALRSNQQQQVQVQEANGQPVYAIQPTNPQIVYVPQYDPTVVYAGSGAMIGASLISFGIGIGIGALLINTQPWGWGGWGWNWGSRRVYYNHGFWGGWRNGYRPPRPYYRPRPVIYANRPGFGGNWRYRPRNYQPPMVNRPGFNRPGFNRPGARPGSRPGNPGVPRNVNRPAAPNRPQNRPAAPRNRPAAPQNRPAPQTRQARPAAPQSRPAPQTRQARPAAPQNRPAPQSRQNRPAPEGAHGDGGR